MKPLSYRGAVREPLVGVDAVEARRSYFRIYGLGPSYWGGISMQYSDEYPGELSGIIHESDFRRTMSRINTVIRSLWPCYPLMFVNLFFPARLCSDACLPHVERKLIEDLRDISLHARYYDRSIVFSLKKDLFRSWIEISVPEGDSMRADVEIGRGDKES